MQTTTRHSALIYDDPCLGFKISGEVLSSRWRLHLPIYKSAKSLTSVYHIGRISFSSVNVYLHIWGNVENCHAHTVTSMSSWESHSGDCEGSAGRVLVLWDNQLYPSTLTIYYSSLLNCFLAFLPSLYQFSKKPKMLLTSVTEKCQFLQISLESFIASWMLSWDNTIQGIHMETVHSHWKTLWHTHGCISVMLVHILLDMYWMTSTSRSCAGNRLINCLEAN